MTNPILHTPRLLLRPWRSSDLEYFAQINADPKVMEFYPHPLTREESDKLAEKFQSHFSIHGYGFWAVEIPNIAKFIGYVGLNYWNLNTKFAPCIDIGWRLAFNHWGFGFATEGAKAALRFGFETMEIPEIVSMATFKNIRSQSVMQRLGMKHNPSENFEHPMLPSGHPLSLRVLYRLKRKEWNLSYPNN